MKILDKIVTICNDNLVSTVLNEAAFQNSAIYGLSYQTVPRDESPLRPYTWIGDNTTGIEIDDTVNFSIYHRCQNINFVEVSNSFGDGNGMMGMICEMYAVVYADRYKTGYTQEDIIMKISSGLNRTFSRTELGTSGLLKVKTSVRRANNNSVQVFEGEYGNGANCPLHLNSVYFGVQYQLEITASSSCLNCSDC